MFFRRVRRKEDAQRIRPLCLENANLEASRGSGRGLRRRLDLEVWSDVRVRHPS